MLIFPFAYPKSLFDHLKHAALDLQAEIAARMPPELRADICEMFFPVMGEVSFEAPLDAVVLSAEILEDAWIDAAVQRRLATGRELFTLSDAALDDIIAAPPRYQKEYLRDRWARALPAPARPSGA